MDDKTKAKIFDLIDDFLTVRSIITLGAFGIAYYLAVWGDPTKGDPAFKTLVKTTVDLLLGFWFGSKVAQINNQQEVGK